MNKIRLLDLETISPLRSQTCYHAAALAMDEGTVDTVILVSPAEPYVCIGYHQDLEKEVDLEYCRSRGWPVYRREVGGGAVYLDGNQVFVQWVFRPKSLPPGIEERFRLFIQPLILTYQALGIKAVLRPVNDIHVDDKKIGGTGAARIGNAEVIVGSFLLDFDKSAMSKVLRVSSEKMRDKVHQSLKDYMTTIREQIGHLPDRQRIKDHYVRKCAEVLDAEVIPGEWGEAEEARALDLDLRFQSREWLFQKGALKRPGIKIHEGVQIGEASLKAPGGLIRVTARLREGRIDDISISGDFSVFPKSAIEAIENALLGVPLERGAMQDVIEKTYNEGGIQSPGIEPSHWAAAVSLAAP